MTKLFSLLFITSALLLSGCNTSAPNPEDVIDIRKLLAKRAEAIRDKDMETYRQLFMPEYFDGKYRLEDLLMDMGEAFKKYPSVTITQQRAPVETKMNSARVVQRVVYDLEGREKPVEGREILLLRHYEGKWRISGGVMVGLD